MLDLNLLKLEVGNVMYQRAFELYKQFEDLKLNFTLLEFSLLVKSKIKEYDCQIQISIENENIISHSCSCIYYQKNKTLCKHLLCMAFDIEDKFSKQFSIKLSHLSFDDRIEILEKNIIELNSSKIIPSKTKSLSVSEVNKIVKQILEEETRLLDINVNGEISSLNSNKSGHIYFSIKDENSVLSCAMFKWDVSNLNFQLKTGDKVILKGSINVYEPRGSYQFIVKEMKKAGEGDLYAKFLFLKNKLEGEGLFDIMKKKSIPKFPQKIGVVSSPTGAVIQDIINTLKRRFPKVELILYPSSVQGFGAEKDLVLALEYLDSLNLDTLIIARGGGSLEDLWCFNDEILARTIYNLKTPIISAIGHETDFTICDFVCDLRAPTPTAAAEIASPNLSELENSLNNFYRRINLSVKNNLIHRKNSIAYFEYNLINLFDSYIYKKKSQIENFEEKIRNFSINETLKRGFSISYRDDKVIKDINNIKIKDEISTVLYGGKFVSKINSIKKNE